METWIREKLPRVSSDDYGRDETTAQSLLRRHETLELELDSYRAKVGDLRNMCQALVTAGNFDAEKIRRRQVIGYALKRFQLNEREWAGQLCYPFILSSWDSLN